MEFKPHTYILTDIRYEEIRSEANADSGETRQEKETPIEVEGQKEGRQVSAIADAEDEAGATSSIEARKAEQRIPALADVEDEAGTAPSIQEQSRADRPEQGAPELWIVTGGSGTIEFAGDSWRLERGRLLVGPLGGKRPCVGGEAGPPEAAEPLALYRLGFRAADALGAPLGGEAALPFVGVADCAPFSFCAERAQKLYESRAETGAAASLERQIAFQELLLAALRRREEQARSAANLRENGRDAVRRSIERIRREYREPLTVEALAASAGIGRWAYTRLFKELTGRLPLDFLNEVRIGQAKALLLNTEDRLGEIAQRAGFSSEYYFGRRFKRETGLSPGQYRRLRRPEVRVFAPYLEDALLAIGIVPIAQYSHRAWGVQGYLPLGEVPAFDIADGSREDLSRLKPELMLFDDGFERWSLDRLSGIAPRLLLEQPGEAWADKLRGTAALFGREAAAEEALRRYGEETREARASLAAVPGGSAARGRVACLRITARRIMLYAERSGYTGPVLYGELGLQAPPLLRRIPEGQRQRLLRPEDLPMLEADHLFVVFDKCENRLPGEERRLLEHPGWLALPAVRAGRVYETDFFAWMNYGVLAHGRKVRDVMNALR
ncbi:helix-turn-helix domain-containing protein [Saccharibacillus sp. O23]|uniref:helix-turn-helix domain-containing protein n=1 Tax=Saccharibacillus sp. O23 TaxID=2009338 RepID=UPI0015C60143|nr:helix-turn-helix domain-containing protein [Saccharibacillus sp. O23]